MADADAPIIGGTVTSIEGTVLVRGSDGQVRRLDEGDLVKVGDVIITDSSSSVEIDCNTEAPFIVPSNMEFLASEECFAFEGDASENEVVDETIAAVAAALESGGDLLEGIGATGTGSTGNNGHTFIRLGRIVLGLSEDRAATEEELLAVLEDGLGRADLLEQPVLISIQGEYTIVEGETSGSFVVLLNQTPASVTSDITVTLNYSGIAQDGIDFNGVASVVIPAGSNSTTFTIDTIDDALAEGSESLVITIGEITDSNFGAIAADPDASSVTNAVIDETDPDAPNPPDTAYDLRLFAVVQVEGTDESPEFEYVAANEISEDGGIGSYVVLAVAANGVPLAEADQPGGTVTVNVGTVADTADRELDYDSAATVVATVGTTFTIAAIEDAFADNNEVFTLGLDEDWSRASEFEGVAYSGTVTTTITDDDVVPPIAIDDSAETDVDASVVINVSTNDSDPDGTLDLGSIVITQLPTNGIVIVNEDGTVTYTPNEGYVGPDTFQYTIADNDGAVSNVANVAIQVSDGRETAAFTDNWVNGVQYFAYATERDYLADGELVASGFTGDRLDENGDPIMGSFSWAEGEFVVFKIGDVVVAEFLAEQLTGDILFIHDIAGLALSNTNSDQLENTAIFLQALDADLTDGDLSDGLSTNSTSNSDEAFTNGINISEEIRDAFVDYLDPTTGEPLDLQEAGKVMISNALALLGIEFTRQSEVDPNPNDEGGNENVFETQAIDHVTDTVLALADTEEAGERLADDFVFDAREEDIIVAGDGEVIYSSEFLDTEDGNPETARIGFNAAGLVANATPQQVSIVENMEIEIPEGTEAQITLEDGTTRIIGTVVYDDPSREGYIQLEEFVAGVDGEPDRGISNEEITSGALQRGEMNFVYTLWDWTASTSLSIDPLDTYRDILSLEGPAEVSEGETTTEYTLSLTQSIPDAEDGGTDIVVTLTYRYTSAEAEDIVETVSVTIPAGSSSATFTIDTVGDAFLEGREDFVVSITEANIQDDNFDVIQVSDLNSVTTTIIDDGDLFTLELFAVVQVEGTDESPEFEYVKANEVAEDGGVAEYVVLLVGADGNPVLDQPGGTVTINVGAVADTADREVDYDSALTVVATVGTTFTIAAIDDAVADNGEVFTLGLGEDWSLSDANPAISYETSGVTTTILDETDNDPEVPEDNDPITLSIAGPASVVEGETTTDYTLSLVDAEGNAIVAETDIVVAVTYTGTATDGSDYTSETPITISAGSSSATFDLATLDDAIADNGETIVVTISTSDDGGFESLELGDDEVTTTIVDDSNPATPETPDEPDQEPVTLSIAGPASVVEGETTTDYTLSLVDAEGNAIVAETDIVVAVTYTGTATDGSDYTSETPITISAGSSSATFDLATLDDAIADNGETIVVTISTSDDGGFESLELGDDEVTTTIVDDSNPATPETPDEPDQETAYDLRLFAVVQVEGTDESPEFEYVAANEISEDGGIGSYVVLAVAANGVPLAEADQPGGTVTVNVGTVADTADRELDYDSAATVVATVGTTFTIAAIEDAFADNNEVFTLGLDEDWSRAGEFEGVAYSGTVTTTITEPLSASASDVVADEDDLVDGVANNESYTSQISVTGGAADIVSATIDSSTSSNGTWTVSAEGLVTYTLTSAYSHIVGNGANTAEDVDSITVTVTDSEGDTAQVTLNADIVDDVPQVGDFEDLAVEYVAGGTASGTNSAYSPGADGLASVVISGTPQSGVTYSDTTSSTNIGGEVVWTMTASSSENTLYSVSFNENTGDYGFELLNTEVGTESFSFTGSQAAAGPSNSYIVNDEDGNLVVTIFGTGGQVNASTQGIGVAGNNLDPNELLHFEYASSITNVELEYFTSSSSMTVDITLRNSSTGEEETMEDVSLPKATGGSDRIIEIADPGFAFDTVTIFDVDGGGSNSVKINGLSADIVTVLDPDSLSFDVSITDSDGDESSDTFDVTFETPPTEDPLDPYADCEDYPDGFIGIIDGTLLIIGTGVRDYIQISNDGDRIKVSWKTEANNVFEGDIGDFPGFTQHGSVTGGPYEFYIDKDDYDNAIIRGNPGDDYIQVDVDQHDWVILGDDGDDELQQGQAAAVIFGGDGDDNIQGGAGNNYIAGGAGNDTVQGQGSVSTNNLQDSAGTIYGDNRNSTSVDYRDAIALRDQTFTGSLSASSAPIAIDLDGNGLSYLGRDAGVTFTDALTGQTVNTAWVAPSDAILVIDIDQDGVISTRAEYVFTEWSEEAQTDMEAIAEVFDTNQDGVLDAQDERFDQFAVWQDTDSDGVTDESELSSLSDLGIESIDLTYRGDSERRVDGDGDVTVFGQVNVNYEDGSITTAEDVSFAVEVADLLSEEDDLTELLSEGGENAAPSRTDAAAIDIAQLELTLNYEHNENDSFDQHE